MTADEKILQFIKDWHSCVWPSGDVLGARTLRQFARLMVRKGWTPPAPPQDAA